MYQTSSSATSMAQTSNRLLSPDEVILRYPKLVNLRNFVRLAVKLGRESFFGPQLMSECTVFGHNDNPPLPKDAVEQLKKKMHSLYPIFLSSPAEFEGFWKGAVDALNHAMAKARVTVLKN